MRETAPVCKIAIGEWSIERGKVPFEGRVELVPRCYRLHHSCMGLS